MTKYTRETFRSCIPCGAVSILLPVEAPSSEREGEKPAHSQAADRQTTNTARGLTQTLLPFAFCSLRTRGKRKKTAETDNECRATRGERIYSARGAVQPPPLFRKKDLSIRSLFWSTLHASQPLSVTASAAPPLLCTHKRTIIPSRRASLSFCISLPLPLPCPVVLLILLQAYFNFKTRNSSGLSPRAF